MKFRKLTASWSPIRPVARWSSYSNEPNELTHDPNLASCSPDGQGPRPGHLLPRSGGAGGAGRAPAARLSDQLANVPQPDPGPRRRLPRGRSRLPGVRTQFDAAADW